jgi:catechol 2,3-dioxygenase-like lactoylglutathione lyase family enzyme
MKTIEIISLRVSDQQKAKEFYMKLGFELIVEAPMGNGETWVQLGLPGQSTSISLMNFQSLILETEDMEKETRELKTKGIESEKIDDTPWGKFAQLKDPDGNALTLHQK